LFLRVVAGRAAGRGCSATLASNAFAFGELLLFEGLQRKVTAPRKDRFRCCPPRRRALRCVNAALKESSAFAFGELLFFERLQRKVTAPRKDPASFLPGAPPRAEDGRLRWLQTLSPSASYLSLKGCKEK
jgi:hypothetical protein